MPLIKDPFWSRCKVEGNGEPVIGLRILWRRRGIGDRECARQEAGRGRDGRGADEKASRPSRCKEEIWDDDFTLESVDFEGFDEGTTAEGKIVIESPNILERPSSSGGLSGENAGTLQTKGL